MKPIIIYILAAVIVMLSGSRAAITYRQWCKSHQAFTTISTQSSELSRLRNAANDTSLSLRPEGGLAGKVSQSLSRSGISASVLQSLSPEAESIDKGVVHQQATLTIANLSLAHIGRFLDTWRMSQPDWTISRLELSPSGAGTPGADLPLRAVITMEAHFKEHPRPSANTHAGAAR